MSRINVDVVLVDSLIEHVSFTRSQVQVTVHSSVPILGASCRSASVIPKPLNIWADTLTLTSKSSNRKQWLVLISILGYWERHMSFQVQVTVQLSVSISGARVGVSLGPSKTIEQISRHVPLNPKFSSRIRWLVPISISEYQGSHVMF